MLNSQKGSPHEAGIIQVFILLVLLVGLAVGVYLVQTRTNLLPKAANNNTNLFGKAIKFNNEISNTAYVVVKPIFFNLAMPSEWTLDGWINTPKPSSGNGLRSYSIVTLTKPQGAFGLDEGSVFRLSLETQETNGDSRPMFKALLANWTDIQNSHLAYISVGAQNQTVLKADTWNHIAITSSSSGNKCTLKMYINGKLAETAERIMQPTCQISAQQPQEVWFAKPLTSLGGIAGYYYPGLIDDARLHRGLLYTGDFTPGLINPSTTDATNTIALYQFNGNVNDASTYRHNTQMFGQVQFVDSTIGATSTSSSQRVFVTSTTYNGNLSGLSGADAKCQDKANVAKLGGTWKAWLSDGQLSASSRLVHDNTPYKRLDGVTVADNWADLTDGSIDNPISITELGTQLKDYEQVWTGTMGNGEKDAEGAQVPWGFCRNWSDGTAYTTGALTGRSSKSVLGKEWTQATYPYCYNQAALYCFEQTSASSPTPSPTPAGPKPDLVVRTIASVGMQRVGGPTDTTVVIQNIGKAEAGQFTVKLETSKTDGTLIGTCSKNVDKLAVSGSTTVQFLDCSTTYQTIGSYKHTVTVDSENVIAESDENNKRFYSFAVSVNSPIALKVSPKIVNLTIKQGDSASIFTLTSTGATGYNLFGSPISSQPKITWTAPFRGALANGKSVTATIKVDGSISPGTYTGAAIIQDDKFYQQVTVPITITVTK